VAAVDADAPGSRIRLRQASPGELPESDQSADFTIQNRVIELLQPAAGDAVSERFETTISWTATGFIENVGLDVSFNDGQTWLEFLPSTPSVEGMNELTWETPEVTRDFVDVVRVRVRDVNPDADPARGASDAFTLVDRVIVITAPAMGTAWCETDSASILWNSRGYVPEVEIDWRPEPGASWRRVIERVDNTGSFTWTTPDLPADTEEAEIRVRNLLDGAVADLSPPFELTDRFLELLTPVPGDTVSEGDGLELSWSQVCIDSVEVSFRRGAGAPWQRQSVWDATLGLIFWPVPAVDSVETGFQLRLADTSDPDAVFSVSPPFTVLNKRLVVLRPSVSDTLSETERFTIEWQWEGSLAQVDLDYRLDEQASWRSIVRQLPNPAGSTGAYSWLVPEVVSDVAGVQVRVRDSFSTLDDESERFLVIDRALDVIGPASGDSLSEAAPATIQWLTRGVVPAVRIDYRAADDQPWQTVVDGLDNTSDLRFFPRSYAWTVPEVDGDVSTAAVRVVDAAVPAIEATSDAFTVVDRTLAVTAPGSGTVWSEATTQTIRWISTGRIDSVAIDYRLDPEAAWQPIVAVTDNDGEYVWAVPEVDAQHPAAAVRVAVATAPAVEIVSAPFTLANRALSLVAPSPSPRSEWRIGDVREIRWTSTGAIERVDVELGRDGPEGDFEPLAVAIDNDGVFTWEVAGPETYDAYIRLRDVAAAHVVGLSPYPFAIYDLVPPETCADYNHDGTVDLDEVMRIEAIIVGSVAASEADSVNLDCFGDATIDLNDLLGGVDAMLDGAAAGRGRTAGGRFVDGGSMAPVTLRVGGEATTGVASAAVGDVDPYRITLPIQVETAAALGGLLVEISVTGGTLEPRWTATGETRSSATFDWTPVAGDPTRCVATLRASGAPDGPGTPGGLERAQLDALEILLIADGHGQLEVRLERAEAYAPAHPAPRSFAPLPVHLAGRTLPVVPLSLILGQNLPNPFNPATTIRFGLPAGGHAQLGIYDVQGRLVRRLVDRMVPAGFHAVRWDGRDERGVRVASGVYLYRLEAGAASRTRKMTLLR
jgi:hypothetical protein